MTFSIDRTRSFLKIEEPNLLSLHRSTHPVIPSAGYCQEHLCDAFICVVHEYNLHRVYLALHDQLLKSNLVFISDPIRPDDKKLAALLLEARGFLENIGFDLEQVNINFSTATREVIIKDIRVMREPSLALQLDASKMALEDLIAENLEITRKASREQMELKAELADLKGRLVATTAVHQASMAELPADVENRAGFEPDALHRGPDIISDEGEGLRLADAEEELRKVREELDSVGIMLKSTMESLKNAKDEAKQARKEQKLHKHESDLLNEKLKSAQIELDKTENEIEAVRRELREARSALHDRVANNDGVEAGHQAETAGLKAEINRLAAELAGKDLEYTGEIEVLRAALAGANVSLSAEKAKNESAIQEMDALERNAAAELKLLKKKVDSLSAEKQQLEKIAAEIKIKAYGEIERQQQVNQSQRKAAIKKLNALQEEIRKLAEARAVISSPTGMPLVQSGNDISSLPADDLKEISIAGQQASFASDRFRSCEATEYLDFLPDKSLKGIPYYISTDVVEIYRSYNTIQAAPTGKQAQKCDGFVCLVTEGGQSLVYVAWRMNSSGEVLVCLPERVADGDDSCQRMLREGISYFERIGFLIDRLHLEDDPDKRQVQLDNLAVFCRTVTYRAA
ncbi:MAG TPA: hypothetical protein VN642_09935 [Dongiaceae bacterium]|nr:hypothetical protein [Dongiaceae bacterium]